MLTARLEEFIWVAGNVHRARALPTLSGTMTLRGLIELRLCGVEADVNRPFSSPLRFQPPCLELRLSRDSLSRGASPSAERKQLGFSICESRSLTVKRVRSDCIL